MVTFTDSLQVPYTGSRTDDDVAGWRAQIAHEDKILERIAKRSTTSDEYTGQLLSCMELRMSYRQRTGAEY